MLPRSSLVIHLLFLPIYIVVAAYLGLIPSYNLVRINTVLSRFFNTTTPLTKAPSPTNIMSPMVFVARRSEERGHADHGWLKTFHTFSFAMYQDTNHNQFGPLRVINEDRIAPRTGFGTHSHREFEIFSYVVAGELEHQDSMGNTEILKRGDLQMTSAGTGISHSEKAHGSKQTHFLQIWSLPSTSRLQAKYYTRHFSDEEKDDQWVKIVAPVDAPGVKDVREAEGPAPVHSALTLYATLLGAGKTLERPLEGKKGYIHIIQTSGYNTNAASGAAVRITGPGYGEMDLREGDGAYISVGQSGDALKVENTGDITAEILVFDLD